MAKPKGNKFKKQGNPKKAVNRKNSRGGGHGFTKSKELKEFIGSIPNSTDIRSIVIDPVYNAEEEVFVISSGSIINEKPRLAKFNQLSTTSIVAGKASSIPVDFDAKEDLGFFFDSTPSQIEATNTATELLTAATQTQSLTKTAYQHKKQKIIQDESVYISSDDDEDIEENGLNMDDFSSSEDIDMLQALSHWAGNDIMQFEEPIRKKTSAEDDDYALLSMTSVGDVCISEDEEEEKLIPEDDDTLLEEGLEFDSLDNVPESLKNSYRCLIRQEQNRLKREEKKRAKRSNRRARPFNERKNINMLDMIIDCFIAEAKVKDYGLKNVTQRGRSVIIPKIAKLFQIQVIESHKNKNNIKLIKTDKTCIPPSYYQYIEKNNHKLASKKVNIKLESRERTKRYGIKRQDRFTVRDSEQHGKQVASDSTPISSSNIGHKMLAAMGWKEGSSIGNNKDGITEPVKAFMRADRRGLGA